MQIRPPIVPAHYTTSHCDHIYWLRTLAGSHVAFEMAFA